MKEIRHHLNLKQGETSFALWRLSEQEYHQLRQNSLPIKEDSLFLWQLFLSERDNPHRLTLPKAFLTLEHLFGQTTDFFDDWKGSFCFPLLLLLKKPQGSFFYLLRIYDHRGSLSFAWYRVLENGIDDYDINIYREPFDLEFSREAMKQFLSYFYGFLTGVSKRFNQILPPPFLKQIASNLIIYGCREKGLFEEQFESEEEYKQAIEAFEEAYGTNLIEDKSREIQLLLQKITSQENNNS